MPPQSQWKNRCTFYLQCFWQDDHRLWSSQRLPDIFLASQYLFLLINPLRQQVVISVYQAKWLYFFFLFLIQCLGRQFVKTSLMCWIFCQGVVYSTMSFTPCWVFFSIVSPLLCHSYVCFLSAVSARSVLQFAVTFYLWPLISGL